MKILIYLAAIVAIPALCFSADVVVYDHFDDDELDTAWDVAFEHATGWTYQEAGTELSVTEIAGGVSTEWNTVTLSQDFKPRNQFKLSFEFSWDSDNHNGAMQGIGIYLRDGAGNAVAAGGMSDAWIFSSGCKWGLFENYYDSGQGSMPLNGTATIEIERAGMNGYGEVRWDGSKLVSGYNIHLVERIEIVFGYYTYQNSSFGTEAVDLVYLEGEETSLINSPIEISAATGGSSVLQLDAGAANANRNYIFLGSYTGVYPPIPLPGGKAKIYLCWDLFTMVVIEYINKPMFTNFLGQSDGLGHATATLNLPPLDPALVGLTMHFACAMNVPWDFASNSVTVDIVP